jgi:diguanylate cyclase (GGDEF)-like protein/PAS domain S-box-containing protein
LSVHDERLQTLFTSAPVGVLEALADGQMQAVNPELCRMLGYTADELVGQPAMMISDSRDQLDQASQIAAVMQGADGYVAQRRYRRKDGSSVPVMVSASAVRTEAGAIDRMICIITDVTELVNARREVQAAHAELAEAAAFHDAVLAASPDLIFVADAVTNRNIWSSRNLTAMLGYTDDQLKGLGDDTIVTLVHPDDRDEVTDANATTTTLPDGEVVSMRYRVRAADGRYLWLSRRITPFTRDTDGRVTQVLGVARDITDVVQVEERLANVALHDALTGLPNRVLLTDRLSQSVDRSKRNGQQLAVLFCDLDGFKQVNDSGGHAAGDAMLKMTADRLRAALRAEDTAARIGGDEFVVILEPGGRAKTATDPSIDPIVYGAVVAERIRRALAEPVTFQGHEYRVTVSIGMTLTRAGRDPEEVLREADAAMYQAKAQGKNRYQIYGLAAARPDAEPERTPAKPSPQRPASAA